MPDKNKSPEAETDYELALRLAGLRTEGEALVQVEVVEPEPVNTSPKKPEVRVSTLNKPNSILKKWHDVDTLANKVP